MTDPQTKEEILTKRELFAEQFLEHPILYFIVRSWLMSWRAKIAMVLGVALVVGVALGLPKVWLVTPKDVLPEIRISALDEVKAMALERNAKKYLAEGREDYGIMAYHASVVHNQGNLRRIRTFLDLATKRQLSRGMIELDTLNVSALRQANWLRKMSKNQADLELVAGFYDAMEADDEILFLLAPEEKQLSPALRKMMLKALLRQGYIEQFEVLWREWKADGKWGADDEMKLYRAAATAGYGARDRAISAKDFLREHLENGANKVIANRLFETVSFERREAEDYLACLNRLRDWHKDRIQDNSRAWLLLAFLGRKDEALKMADQFNRAPQTAIDTSHLAAAYYELGMRDDAQKLLDQFIERFGFFERLWVQQGTMLLAAKKWTPLRNLIAKMRLDPSVAHRMMGFSYYLEGKSELGEGRPSAAQELFQRITQYGIPNLDVAFTVIDEMRNLGRLDVAAKLVDQVEGQAKDNPRYWMFVLQLGSEMKNEALMLKAAQEYYRLKPDDIAAKSNFAAVLLASRQRPADAVKITFELLTSAPDVPAFQINHAAALALSGRSKDSQNELEKVELARLSDLEKSMYYFVLTEALVGQEKWPQADVTVGRVQERFLYPKQIESMAGWKQKIADILHPKATADAGSPGGPGK